MLSKRRVIVYIPKYDKISVLTKEQKEIIEKLEFTDVLF